MPVVFVYLKSQGVFYDWLEAYAVEKEKLGNGGTKI